MLASFLWGLATGFYHVFPYELVRVIKNKAEGDAGPQHGATCFVR